MAKANKVSVFKDHNSRPETSMEKTTRIVRTMIDEDAEKRQIKLTRLRNARLEREANTPPEPAAKPARKTPRAKAAPKE